MIRFFLISIRYCVLEKAGTLFAGRRQPSKPGTTVSQITIMPLLDIIW